MFINSLRWAIVLWIVVTIAAVWLGYAAGVSADETYFGAKRWHYLADVMVGAWVVATLNLLIMGYQALKSKP